VYDSQTAFIKEVERYLLPRANELVVVPMALDNQNLYPKSEVPKARSNYSGGDTTYLWTVVATSNGNVDVVGES